MFILQPTTPLDTSPAALEAACARRPALVDHLARDGVDLERSDDDGRTILIYAAMRGHIAVVERLLAAGVAVDRRDAWGMDAREWATRMGHTVLRRLLDDWLELADLEPLHALLERQSRRNVDAGADADAGLQALKTA